MPGLSEGVGEGWGDGVRVAVEEGKGTGVNVRVDSGMGVTETGKLQDTNNMVDRTKRNFFFMRFKRCCTKPSSLHPQIRPM